MKANIGDRISIGFNTTIPKDSDREKAGLTVANMVIILRELAKTHGIKIGIMQAYDIIVENKEKLTTTLIFCRFFEDFVKNNAPNKL